MLDIFPVEIIYIISTFLDNKSLINFSLTCQYIYHINTNIIQKRYNLFKKYCANQDVENIINTKNLFAIKFLLTNYPNKILNGKTIEKLISINDKSILNQISNDFLIKILDKNHANLLHNYLSQTIIPICILPGSYFPRNYSIDSCIKSNIVWIKSPLVFSLKRENTFYMKNL
jgi:hypothetical protein